ncbi:TIGR02996 domain-containing protein [Limnoglobus roseus]|uniref:TIGR02996 domain-containing protein n=1 Tax=Limnoglobus roseus TaxID=2598579 RepID=A0A5C1AJK0_9BACT|nr:TIGR02996 domain-containing protein [Limnoglobus roseus]QEL19040.1 TIGR02996 domain-containing protein [Limnoglobus roseus]
MNAPPDALALFRAVLANPADDTPRLVFADWLEETGEPHNVAWAEYLRLHTCSQGWAVDARKMEELSAPIRAQLLIRAETFIRHRPLLLELLPAKNISLRLTNYTPLVAYFEITPMSIAFENQIVPLMLAGNTLYFATPTPTDCDLLNRLGFVFNRDIVLVRAGPQDVADCLTRTFGDPSQYEFFDSVLIEHTEPIILSD